MCLLLFCPCNHMLYIFPGCQPRKDCGSEHHEVFRKSSTCKQCSDNSFKMFRREPFLLPFWQRIRYSFTCQPNASYIRFRVSRLTKHFLVRSSTTTRACMVFENISRSMDSSILKQSRFIMEKALRELNQTNWHGIDLLNYLQLYWFIMVSSVSVKMHSGRTVVTLAFPSRLLKTWPSY